MKSICLNMIVKNEAHIIERCLDAVKNYIDYWVIVDTGSTDQTQDLIQKCMQGYPGELHKRPWHNFEYNRNEALKLARDKADYSLFVDADELIRFRPNFSKTKLAKDYYFVKTIANGLEFYIAKLIKNSPRWRWTHKIHEFIQHEGHAEGEILTDLYTESMQDGARSRDPYKLDKDIAILLQAIEEEPWNARYVFYLGQTYITAKKHDLALNAFQKRVSMQGDYDETFWSLFSIGQMQEILNMNPHDFLKSYDKAYQFDPSRAEPLERIATYFFQNNCFSIAYSLMKYAQTLPTPTPLTSGYFNWVYDFAVYSICADCAMVLGKIEEAKELYLKLLDQKNSPEGLQEHIKNQLAKIKKAAFLHEKK